MTLPVGFWEKVDRRGPDECWPWTAGLTSAGYGQCSIGPRKLLAHRVAYEAEVGPIPSGLQLDHVRERGCVMRHCCNPAHLEPVTSRENTLRGRNIAASRAQQTHCSSGHEFTESNTYVKPNGCRDCRTCKAERQRILRSAA